MRHSWKAPHPILDLNTPRSLRYHDNRGSGCLKLANTDAETSYVHGRPEILPFPMYEAAAASTCSTDPTVRSPSIWYLTLSHIH